MKGGMFHMKHPKTAALLAACLVASSLLSVPVSAATVADVKHLQEALLTIGKMTKTDDYNGDGKVNAKDLTLIKRDLLKAAEQSGEVTTKTYAATEDNVKLIGRTLTDGDTVWLVQSGSAAECTITGTAASVTIAGDGCVYSDEKYRPRYGVYVDSELVADVVMGEEEQTVELFSGKTQRTATVKVIHLSEANNGAVGVKSYSVTSSAAKPVKPTAKKNLTVEFIGDSITCAYGVEADSQYVSFSTGTENFTLSYAYLTAALLDADYSAVCYSGHGIVSGYSNDGTAQTDSLVPDYYEKVGKIDSYGKASWDFASHPVDAILINLGTNDDSYATKDLETRGLEYQKGYEAFLKQVRKNNPDAAIVCTLGVMGCQELYPYIEAAVKAVGDPKISCYESQTHNFQKDGIGADWHPSAKTHELNSYIVADKICEALGIPSSKIGIDLAAGAEYSAEIADSPDVNAWPYYSDFANTLNINAAMSGDTEDAITAHVKNMSLPAGSYELSFELTAPPADDVKYELRSMSDPTKVYFSGKAAGGTDPSTIFEKFDMKTADDACELVFYLGNKGNYSTTLGNLTLYKRA